MSATEQSEVELETAEMQIRELLTSLQKPPTVLDISVEFGSDHVGEPAARVFLSLDPKFAESIDKDKTRLKQLVDFRSELTLKILDTQRTYFPFVRVGVAA